MKPKLLLSACLAGKNTKYSGGNNLISTIPLLEEYFEIYLICPEVMGGLSTPRDPSEQKYGRVISNQGKDVTLEFSKGAEIALAIAKKNNIHLALLKESSPSCGSHLIYDGTFSGRKIKGEGVTAELLRKNGLKIYSENEVEELLQNNK